MTPTSPQHPFMATILLAEPVVVTNAMLKSALTGIWPKIADGLVIGGEDDAPATLCAIPGKIITLIQSDAPVPASVFQRALAMGENRWPQAQAAIDGHKAHVVVSMLDPGSKPLDAVSEALFTTAVTAAVAASLEALGVHWPASETFVSGEDFITQSQGMQSNELPLQLWFQLIPLDVNNPQTSSSHRMMLSEGLRAFTGHELEFAPSTTIRHEDMAPRMISLAETLITQGPVAKDGGTFGLSEADRCRLKFKPHGVRPNLPVLELTAEALETPGAGSSRRKAFGKRTG
ncbi:MAG: hypothetical protein HKN11_03465 [Rhizobiales bacterium]|nr:hypothetical protein [Hyphomicrobiales bacterium]